MKIYTKKGDKGKTSLGGLNSISKADVRIELLGELDELSCVLGLVKPCSEPFHNQIEIIQKILSSLCCAVNENKLVRRKARLSRKQIVWIESHINELQKNHPLANVFILPGHSVPEATTQLARAVCRRAERKYVACSHKHQIDPLGLVFLNRLSDYLFVLARVFSSNISLNKDSPRLQKE